MSVGEIVEPPRLATDDTGARRRFGLPGLAGSDGGGGDGTSLGASWGSLDDPETALGQRVSVPVLEIGKYGLAGAEKVGAVSIPTATASAIGQAAAYQAAVRLS
jgi:hypothetical protein